jgi:MFS family permease
MSKLKILFFNSAVGPLLGAAFVPLAKEFDVPLATFLSGVQGGLIAAIAVGSLVFNSLAVKYGKRPIYLATTVGMMVSCFWAAEATSFASLVASRVLCGLCMAPMEALIPASIADIWYKGVPIFFLLNPADVLIGLCTSEASEPLFLIWVFWVELTLPLQLVRAVYLRPLHRRKLISRTKAAPIIEFGSYRIALHAMGGALGLALIMIIFWMPESAYTRTSLNIDTGNETVSLASSGCFFLGLIIPARD